MSAGRLERRVLAAAAALSLAVGLLAGLLYAIEPQLELLLRLAGCLLVVVLVGVLWSVPGAARREGRAFDERLLLLSSLCLLVAVAIFGGLTAKQLLETHDPRTTSRGRE